MFSRNPNIWRVLTFEKITGDCKGIEEFDIDVKFQHPNYISLIRELYNANKKGNIRCDDNGGISDDFLFVPYLQLLIKQLENDGYVSLGFQKCTYETEFGKSETYGPDGLDESYINAEKFFSVAEKKALETSIMLTTKGQSELSFFREKIISEPIGILSLVLSIISIIISIIK
jgi:hypothetical protein